jgi:hypothetical protein
MSSDCDGKNMRWETVKKRNHSSQCKRRVIKGCYISRPIKTSSLCLKHMEVFNNVQRVSIKDNAILDAILSDLSCLCTNSQSREFVVAPDNKYKIILSGVNKENAVLQQWCCHYDKITGLIPISVRKVIIEF